MWLEKMVIISNICFKELGFLIHKYTNNCKIFVYNYVTYLQTAKIIPFFIDYFFRYFPQKI